MRAFGLSNPGFVGRLTTAAPASYLLDQLGVTTLTARSTRKLRAGYTGNAIKVRRSSDSTLLDIGFTSTGELDESALLTFVGSGSGFVHTWYDQSGGGNHAVMATAANQPRIVNAGAVVKAGSKPVVQFTGSSSTYLEAPTTFTATLLSLAVVGQMNSASGDWTHFHSLSRSGVQDYNQASTISILQRNSNSSQLTAVQNGSPRASASFTNGAMLTVLQQFDTSVNTLYLNGTSAATAGVSISVNITLERVGAGFGPGAQEFLDGYYGEHILFNSTLSSASRTTLQTSQKAYFGTP